MDSPQPRHPLELRIPPPLVAGAAALTQWLLTRSAPRPTRARKALAALLMVSGQILGATGLLQFRNAGTTAMPHHPDEATVLVTSGVYGRTRNPMYVSGALVLLAFAIYRGHLLALPPILAYAAYVQRFQIRPEEAALRARFGQDYETYAGRVRRWI